MTQSQRTEIEELLKPNQVAVDTQDHQTGTDENGYPVFETVYENPPANYKLVRMIPSWNGAVLENLDYVEPTQ